MTEMDKLEQYLRENGYNYKHKSNYDSSLFRLDAIVVYDENGDYLWDAICHRGSYGYEEGKLEIMGTIVRDDIEDTVEGWLTAQDIIDRLEAK